MVSSAPIYDRDHHNVIGSLTATETEERWTRLRDRALTDMLNFTLITSAVAVIAMFAFAAWLAVRLSRLRRASESALRELARHREHARAGLELLLQVNVAREPGKAGIAPEQLESFLARAPLPVAGLMTMPPLAEDPADSRRWFAALRELAAAHGLPQLSMGTSQDYPVAVAEGATIVRIGARLYA